jgi:hypothetical protein
MTGSKDRGRSGKSRKEPDGNVSERLVEDGVSVTGDPIFQYKGYSIFVGIIENKEGHNDLPHYLIFNDEHGVVEGATNKIAEARMYAVALADANMEQIEKLERGESLADRNARKTTDKSDWN